MTGDLSSVVTTAQQTQANTLLEKLFMWAVDFIYTLIDIAITFITQPAVLWAIAVITVIVIAYRMFRSKVWV